MKIKGRLKRLKILLELGVSEDGHLICACIEENILTCRKCFNAFGLEGNNFKNLDCPLCFENDGTINYDKDVRNVILDKILELEIISVLEEKSKNK